MFIIVNWVFTLTSHHLPISFFLNASIIDRVLVMFQYNIIAILWWRYVECIDIFNFGYGPATCWIVLVLLSLFFLSSTDLDLFLLMLPSYTFLKKEVCLAHLWSGQWRRTCIVVSIPWQQLLVGSMKSWKMRLKLILVGFYNLFS